MATPCDVRYRLVRLMKVHDRTKLAKIDQVLDGNAGKEEELVRKCVAKYGAEPEPEPFATRLERYFKAKAPKRVGEVSTLCSSNRGRDKEWALLATLVQQHGPEPDPPTPRGGGSGSSSGPTAPGAASGDMRDRLTKYYAHYAPEKTSVDIDKALEKYAENYEKMWSTLEKKYGPESAVRAGATAPVPSSGESKGARPNAAATVAEQKKRLIRFYQHYAPGKGESEVDKAIEKYSASGDFDKMWKILESKYGPESAIPSSTALPPQTSGPAAATTAATPATQPPSTVIGAPSGTSSDAAAEQKRRLLRFYHHYAPNKTEEDVDKAIAKYSASGNFDGMWKTLEEKYGPEASIPIPGAVMAPTTKDLQVVKVASPVEAQKDRLRRFFAKYAPGKSEQEMDSTIERYSRAPGGFEKMWTMLESTYGPENATGAATGSTEVDPATDVSWLTPALLEHKRRLIAFYAHYVPEKSEQDILRTLFRYNKSLGGVSAMWEQLRRKYGPEPTPDAGGLTLKDRLRRFFAHYAPEKTEADIDATLKKYGAGAGADDMWSVLERRYGPENYHDPSAKPRSVALSRPTFNITKLLPPTSTIDDDPKPLKLRRAVDLGGKSRQIAASHSSSIVGSAISILHVLIKLFGAELALYERAPTEKRTKFRDALEADIASNCGVQQRNVRVVRLTSVAGILCEVDIELPVSVEAEAVSDQLLARINAGVCTCAATRDSYRKDLGGNATQLYFEDVTVLAGTTKPHTMQTLVANNKGTFSEEYLSRRQQLVAPDLLSEARSPPAVQPVAAPISAHPGSSFATPLRDARPYAAAAQASPSTAPALSPFLQSLWDTSSGTTVASNTRASPAPVAPYFAPQQLLNPLSGSPQYTAPTSRTSQPVRGVAAFSDIATVLGGR